MDAAYHCDRCSVRASLDMLSALIKFSIAHFLGFASLVHGRLLRSLSGVIPPDGGCVPSDYYAKMLKGGLWCLIADSDSEAPFWPSRVTLNVLYVNMMHYSTVTPLDLG